MSSAADRAARKQRLLSQANKRLELITGAPVPVSNGSPAQCEQPPPARCDQPHEARQAPAPLLQRVPTPPPQPPLTRARQESDTGAELTSNPMVVAALLSVCCGAFLHGVDSANWCLLVCLLWFCVATVLLRYRAQKQCEALQNLKLDPLAHVTVKRTEEHLVRVGMGLEVLASATWALCTLVDKQACTLSSFLILSLMQGGVCYCRTRALRETFPAGDFSMVRPLPSLSDKLGVLMFAVELLPLAFRTCVLCFIHVSAVLLVHAFKASLESQWQAAVV